MHINKIVHKNTYDNIFVNQRKYLRVKKFIFGNL